MTTESRISFLEGALTQVSERLRDHTERFTAIARDIQSLRSELNAHRAEMNANVESLRAEMNANVESLRAEMNANVESLRAENATTRRESRWIGGIIISGIVVVVITNLVMQVF
ncbi:MAG: hypothetical protein OXI54_09095 [Chloroflexota bacterium]|nr:hypothetical protein [Chloroflexota bacterium]